MVTPDQVFDGIRSTTDTLANALEKLNELQKAEYNAKIALKNREAAILNEYSDTNRHPDGLKELGSNAENRKAAIAALSVGEADALAQAEFAVLQQRGIVEQAKIRNDEQKLYLRLLELASQALINA